jgi:hypothetical protein
MCEGGGGAGVSACADLHSLAVRGHLSRRFHPQYFVTRTGVT